MQCKDIPNKPILAFLAQQTLAATWGGWARGGLPTVQDAMPPGVPPKLQVAKMRQMIRRGLVSGCPCGCRGDFTINGGGRKYLAESTEA